MIGAAEPAVIRRAEPADAAAIAAIWNTIIRDTTQTFTTAEKDARDLARRMPDSPFFVAESAGAGADAVLGFATYGQFRGGPGYAQTMEHTVHVAQAARGRGVGRGLLLACEDHARAAGAHSIFAGVAGENPGGVLFHAAMGYAEIVRLKDVGRKFGRWHDLVLMQKFL